MVRGFIKDKKFHPIRKQRLVLRVNTSKTKGLQINKFKKNIKVKTKKTCNENSIGEADINKRIVFVCTSKIKNKKEIPAIEEHEKAHIIFNDILQKNPNKIRIYSEQVLNSIPFSDDLEKMKGKIKTATQRGDYINEYYAQTKELQFRINNKLNDKNEFNTDEFKQAKKNLRALEN